MVATKAREALDTIWTAREAAGDFREPYGRAPGTHLDSEAPESHVDNWEIAKSQFMDHESYLGGPGGPRQLFGLLGRLQRPMRTAQEAAKKPPWKDSPGGSEPVGQPRGATIR